MIQFTCSSCARYLKISEQLSGKKCRCPSCKNLVDIPAAESALGRRIKFSCSACGQVLQASTELEGRLCRCPKCNNLTRIAPGPQPAAAAAPAPATAPTDLEKTRKRENREAAAKWFAECQANLLSNFPKESTFHEMACVTLIARLLAAGKTPLEKLKEAFLRKVRKNQAKYIVTPVNPPPPPPGTSESTFPLVEPLLNIMDPENWTTS
jgi:hypothetical protein